MQGYGLGPQERAGIVRKFFDDPIGLAVAIEAALHTRRGEVEAAQAQPARTGLHPEMGWLIEAATDGELAAYTYGGDELLGRLQDILSGKDTGAGVSREPWEPIRRKLIALVAAQPASAPTVQPSETCPRGDDKPEPTCTNRHQCWEPCGELGHSMEHARLSRTAPEEVDRILGIARAPEAAGEQPVVWRACGKNEEVEWTYFEQWPDWHIENGYEVEPLYTSPQPAAPAQARMPLSKELVAALEWYACEAEATARNLEQFKDGTSEGAILASLQVLALDGGRRARTVIEAAHGIQGESSGAAPGVQGGFDVR